ncbi:MAG: FAD-dependent oxidoreductase [Devosia sp.]
MGRIVILGGGYAGLHAFAALRKRLRRELKSGEAELTLVSRDSYHTYHGWTGEVLSGRLAVERTLTPIVPLLRDHFLQAEVAAVDLEARTISVKTEQDGDRTLAFDHLLLATGSRDPFDRLPGLAEHGWCVKNTRDMQSLVGCLDALDDQPKAVRNIVVIGGGLAGVETASALALRFGQQSNMQIAVHLVSSGPRLLGALRPDFARIAEHATAVLRDQGVEVHFDRRAARIDEDQVVFDDGTALASHVAIATAGVSFAILPGTEALPRNRSGQIGTESTLEVIGQQGLWAAGDLAAVRHPSTGEPCPTNALWAMKQGDLVGRNIARALKGKEAGAFRFKGMGQAAGLAGRSGIAELYNLQFTGKAAWLLRILFFAWYMPSRPAGFSIVGNLLAQWLAPARLAAPSYQAAQLRGAALALRRLPRS